MKKLLISLVMVCGLLFIVNVIITAAQTDESYYGEIARDFLHNPDKNNILSTLQNQTQQTWDLKFTAPSLTDSLSVFMEYGICVTSAGDVNGDGYTDILVGADGNNYTGWGYLYYGGPNMDTVVDLVFKGENLNDHFGYSIAGVGDVNKDGFDDILIGAFNYNNYSGRAYLYYGGVNMDSIADIILNSEANEESFGKKVAGAGDVNGDGFADILISADGYMNSTGRVYLYYGGSDMDTIADVILSGEAPENSFGGSIAGAGDVNNDGYDDILIGAFTYENRRGKVYLYFGGVTIDTVADVFMLGDSEFDQFGYSVAFAGDVNNDGYEDVMIGANGFYYSMGRVYLYYGNPNICNVADVIISGQEDLYNNIGLSVAGIGDVNKDGFADILIGAESLSDDKLSQVNLYYGGLVMDNIADFIIKGESKRDYFGTSIASAGDVNSDGFNDIIIGAYQNGEHKNGAAYLYFGNQTLDVEEAGSKTLSLPNHAQLLNNYPNPFNPATNIEFELPGRANVEVVVYDVSGRRVRNLLHEWRAGGRHRVCWDGRDDAGLPVSSGVYLCRLSTDKGYAETKKMTLLK